MAGDVPGTAPEDPGRPSSPPARLALYRRYRPATFAEVKGQDHVTEPLRQALRSGRVNHAYLFSGPRGCGKTSSARILARSLNCAEGPTPDPCGKCESCVALAPDGPGSLDVIEIDAASHGGVDDARDLRERAFYSPVSGRFKIYIIDEAHMVTREGFNALLKLVEEPPPHLKFVFATTEPEKVIATIRSRTHHYPFRLVPPAVLRVLLEEILAAEGIAYEPAVLPLVVRAGAGSARDSLSVLDQLLAGSGEEGLRYDRTVSLLGYTDDSLLDEVADAFAAGDGAAVFGAVNRVVEGGHDPRRFAADMLDRFRDLIVLAAVPGAGQSGLLDLPADRIERMSEQALRFGQAELTRAAEIISDGLIQMRGTTSPRLLLELMCAQVLLPSASTGEKALLARLERLERRLENGEPAPTAPAAPTGTAAPAGPDGGTREHPAGEAPGRADPARAAHAREAQARAASTPQTAAGDPASRETPGRESPGRRPAAPAAGPSGAPSHRAASPAGREAAGREAAGREAAGREAASRETASREAPSTPSAASTSPASAPAASPPAAARGSVRPDFESVSQHWPEILDAVRAEHKVAWILLRDTAVESVEDSVLTVRFAREGEAKGFASSSYDADLTRVLTEWFGAGLRLKTVVAAQPGRGAGSRADAGRGGSPDRPGFDDPGLRDPGLRDPGLRDPGGPDSSASDPAGPDSGGNDAGGYDSGPHDPDAHHPGTGGTSVPAPRGAARDASGPVSGGQTAARPAAGAAGEHSAAGSSAAGSSAAGVAAGRSGRGAKSSSPSPQHGSPGQAPAAAASGDLTGMDLIKRELGGRIIAEIDDT